MARFNQPYRKWRKDGEYRTSFDAIEAESALAEAIAGARARAGLTQEEVAQRMRTTQGNIARMEAGRTMPSTRTLNRFALAVGATLTISFEPRHN